jgi:hypothetical protein
MQALVQTQQGSWMDDESIATAYSQCVKQQTCCADTAHNTSSLDPCPVKKHD